jgi:hypothetical protein
MVLEQQYLQIHSSRRDTWNINSDFDAVRKSLWFDERILVAQEYKLERRGFEYTTHKGEVFIDQQITDISPGLMKRMCKTLTE